MNFIYKKVNMAELGLILTPLLVSQVSSVRKENIML
nr:MAG TPA: hypothetical protein [Caudoviricetes sp.]